MIKRLLYVGMLFFLQLAGAMQQDLPMHIQQNVEGISFATGYRILEEKNGGAIVGMSSGNSYFKREVIANLLQTGLAYFLFQIFRFSDSSFL